MLRNCKIHNYIFQLHTNGNSKVCGLYSVQKKKKKKKKNSTNIETNSLRFTQHNETNKNELFFFGICLKGASCCTLTINVLVKKRVSAQSLLSLCFIEILVFYANTVAPDQTPRSVASDLGLHCLPMSLFRGRQAYLAYVG